MRLRDLSLKVKIPLRGSVLIIITAAAVSAALVAREYDDFKRDLVETADAMGRVLAHTLVAPLVHDDVWRAYEIITSPYQPGIRADSPLVAEWLVIVDPNFRVYVSSRAEQFPVLAQMSAVVPEFGLIADALRTQPTGPSRLVDYANAPHVYMATPVLADGVVLGYLIMAYSRDMFLQRLFGIIMRAGLVTLVVLGLVIAASWYWAQRFAVPLVSLAECMGRVGAAHPDEIQLTLEESRDEVGRLATAFRRMLADLREKTALERQVIATERLAALGRLSAGIAHEINNPLGGMLNAIDTFRRHGNRDAMALRTLSLLERGLMQIKETVGALLIEAMVASHPLTPADIADVHRLVLADAHEKQARLDWHSNLRADVALPSTLVRQILINLLLNAVRAVHRHGRVDCHVERSAGDLSLRVENDGEHIPADRLDRLFEPFLQSGGTGHGLGLWVTYQLVQQLNGRITASSRPGETVFTVELPIPRAP
jgi:signal transduction histidine kinase